MIEVIDTTAAEIVSIGTNFMSVDGRLSRIYVTIKAGGFSKTVVLEGESFNRILEVIKEELNSK